MDKLSSSVKSSQNDSLGFFKYVFNFDDDNKVNIMNMIQYTILSIIPVLIILKVTKNIVPEEDESKGSLEILVESVGQIVLIMLSIWFTNKIIQYIPTYSGEDYPKFNAVTFIIPFLIILATMQTKLGAKLNILVDRTMDLINGKGQEQKQGQGQQGQGQQGQGQVRVMQPLAGVQHQPSQADYLDRSQILPSNPQMSAMPQQQQQQVQQVAPQQSPDFNQMYNNQVQEPMAANAALGGGMFGTW
jgi:hypothetical protein